MKVWEIDLGKGFIGSWRKNICISRGNRKINPLYQKDFIHLSESGSPGWGFVHLTRLVCYGGLVPLHNLTTWKFSIWWVILFLIQSTGATYVVFVIFYLVFYFLASLSLKNCGFYFSRNFHLQEKNCFCKCICMQMESLL